MPASGIRQRASRDSACARTRASTLRVPSLFAVPSPLLPETLSGDGEARCRASRRRPKSSKTTHTNAQQSHTAHAPPPTRIRGAATRPVRPSLPSSPFPFLSRKKGGAEIAQKIRDEDSKSEVHVTDSEPTLAPAFARSQRAALKEVSACRAPAHPSLPQVWPDPGV